MKHKEPLYIPCPPEPERKTGWTRGQLLTYTFKRMGLMGIIEAEDIIAKLAEEIEEYKTTIKDMCNEHTQQTEAVQPVIYPCDIPEDLRKMLSSIDIGADGSVSMYFEHKPDVTDIIYADREPYELNYGGKTYRLCSDGDVVSSPPAE